MYLDFCGNVRRILNSFPVLIHFFSLLLSFFPNLFEGFYNKRVTENIFLSLRTALVISIKKRTASRFLWIILQYQTVF